MRLPTILLTALLATALAPGAFAHAFPKNSDPHVGATVATAPHAVKIWFDGELEPVFSTLTVKDAAGKQVSSAKGEVAPKDHFLLETTLPAPLPAGPYTVYWSVIAHDGHHSEGHFAFTVK